MRDDPGFGPVALVALAVALLSGMDAAMKLQTTFLPLVQAVALRYLVATSILLPIFLVRPQRLGWTTLRANVLRGIIVVITALCFFYAIATLPLALVIAIAFVAPFFIALLGWLILDEPIHPRTGIGIAAGFVGVLVIFGGELRIGVSPDALLGFAAALAGAFGYALVAVLMRRQAASDRATTMVLLQTAAAAVLITPVATLAWEPMDRFTAVLALLIGALGAFGQLAIAAGFARAPAARLGVLEYTSFLWATLFGLVLFAEIPRIETVTGAAIIVAACLIALRPAKVAPVGRATARAPHLPPPQDG